MTEIVLDFSFLQFWVFWFWGTMACLNFSIVYSKKYGWVTCFIVGMGSFLVAHTSFLMAYSVFFRVFTDLRTTWNIWVQVGGGLVFLWWLRKYPLVSCKFRDVWLVLMPLHVGLLFMSHYVGIESVVNLNYLFRMLWFIGSVKMVSAFPDLSLGKQNKTNRIK